MNIRTVNIYTLRNSELFTYKYNARYIFKRYCQFSNYYVIVLVKYNFYYSYDRNYDIRYMELIQNV